MSKWWLELKGAVQWSIVFPLALYASLLIFILQSDQPRNLFYLNEMFIVLLIVLLTYVLFQREIGSGMMEMVSTYPLSFTVMVLRKLALLNGTVLACHMLLMAVYAWWLGPLRTTMFPWDGGAAVIRTAEWWELYVQALPGYVIVSAVTVFGFMLTKRAFGGLGLGLAYWMLEGMTAGSLTKSLGLYTVYLPDTASFLLNRLLLVVAGSMLIVAALIIMNKRSRWIVADSD